MKSIPRWRSEVPEAGAGVPWFVVRVQVSVSGEPGRCCSLEARTSATEPAATEPTGAPPEIEPFGRPAGVKFLVLEESEEVRQHEAAEAQLGEP